MEKKYLQLQQLESRANKYATNALNANRYFEVWENPNSHLSRTRNKWEQLMTELRGWYEHQGDSVTKPEWIEYCNKHGLTVTYSFGDCLA